MDITAETFCFHLPRLLDDLATCHFVSIDCEFSGIPTANTAPSSGKSTLQKRYDEYRAGADKYSIVQIGLTVGHEDTRNATYTLRPYNLYLNPSVDQKLDLERDICFQSSAMKFLLQNQFSLASLYNDGVQYLSRQEEDRAMTKASAKFNRTPSRAVLEIKETERDSIEFVGAVRKLVQNWLALGKTREPYLNIPPPSGDVPNNDTKLMPLALNNYQKRLVHQLIEVEYPSLVTISYPTFIQIIDYDETREKAIREQRMKRARERVSKQTGFRWVAEVLAGGDLTHLDPYCFRTTMSTSTAVKPQASLKAFSDKMKQLLRTRRPVLVGHNLFVDLVYFCRCFFGPLPDSVQDFQRLVHRMFPVLVDTKYLATHQCGSIIPRSSLSEINEKLLQTATPKIKIHHQHAKYNGRKFEHEAGYDSLLTAQIFIKLSAQLRDGEVSETKPQRQSSKESSKPQKRDAEPNGIGLPTRFDVLGIDEAGDVDRDLASEDEQIRRDEAVEKAGKGQLIPRSDAEFWQVYSNKLRVFGTEESVCYVGDP